MVTGPGLPVLAISVFQSIVIYLNISWVFCLAPFQINKLNNYMFSILTISLGLFLNCLFTYVTFSDPGFLLRHSNYEELSKREDIKDYIEKNKKLEKQLLKVSGEEHRIRNYRFCESCLIWRPPLSSHCPVC